MSGALMPTPESKIEQLKQWTTLLSLVSKECNNDGNSQVVSLTLDICVINVTTKMQLCVDYDKTKAKAPGG